MLWIDQKRGDKLPSLISWGLLAWNKDTGLAFS